VWSSRTRGCRTRSDAMTSDAPGWRDTAVLLFVLLNLTVIGGDVAIAHAGNHYRAPAEWWPVEATFIFFAAAIGIVAPWAIRGVQPLGRTGRVILRTSSCSHRARRLWPRGALPFAIRARHPGRRYIFSAPIIAPLAYAGLGILGLAFLDCPPCATSALLLALATLGLAGNRCSFCRIMRRAASSRRPNCLPSAPPRCPCRWQH